MDYALLGRTGVKVSNICLGTMTFGNEADEATSRAIMDRALESGINFFDTANIYNKGKTEEIVGHWLTPHRDEIVLASKVYFPAGEGINDRRSSRRHITMELENSLKRLRTDRLDILYLHHWDDDTGLEQSLAALETLMQQGKVLYGAVSNFAAWQTMKALAVATARSFNPIVCIQPQYNFLKRQAEVEILPMALAEGLGVCPYSPIAAGVLTGKYLAGETGRVHVNAMYKERYKNPEYAGVVQRFVARANEMGVKPAALAVAWVRSHPAVTSAIIGARNLNQLETALESVSIALTSIERESISALGITPPLATDRENMSVTQTVIGR
ncbi:MAG: aldo/keto reductase [Candidatus Hydrogenedentota bacterium]